jgi:hypothetical protein
MSDRRSDTAGTQGGRPRAVHRRRLPVTRCRSGQEQPSGSSDYDAPVPQWLSPTRHAERLFVAALDVSEEIRGPSAFANGVLFTFLDAGPDAEEGMTDSARNVAMYAARFGYALRVVEAARRTARPFDAATLGRLERAREESPERRQALLDAALSESDSEMERDYLTRLHGAGDDHYYNGESEVFDELILGEDPTGWLQGESFFNLTGHNAKVWQILVGKATQAANASLLEEDPAARTYPWEAVREFLRFGYLLRCGDEFIHYVPERVEGGDWP